MSFFSRCTEPIPPLLTLSIPYIIGTIRIKQRPDLSTLQDFGILWPKSRKKASDKDYRRPALFRMWARVTKSFLLGLFSKRCFSYFQGINGNEMHCSHWIGVSFLPSILPKIFRTFQQQVRIGHQLAFQWLPHLWWRWEWEKRHVNPMGIMHFIPIDPLKIRETSLGK